MLVDFGCSAVGGVFEFSPYGWTASMSMIGLARRLLRYATPRSRRNVVGEWGCLAERALSAPRGATAPPVTVIPGEPSLRQSQLRVCGRADCERWGDGLRGGGGCGREPCGKEDELADGRHPAMGIGRPFPRLAPSAGLPRLDEDDARALRQARRLRIRGGLAEGREARLWLLVGVIEAGLPACEIGLVEGVEDEQTLDCRLACGQLERLAVVTRLGLRVDGVGGRGRLEIGIGLAVPGRDGSLHAEFRVVDRQTAAALGRPGEGSGQKCRQLWVVADRDRCRFRVSVCRRKLRRAHVG